MVDLAMHYFNEGYNFARYGRYSEAMVSYEKAIAINPDDLMVWNHHGNTLSELGQYAEVVDSFDRTIAFNSNGNEARKNLKRARLCEDMGNT